MAPTGTLVCILGAEIGSPEMRASRLEAMSPTATELRAAEPSPILGNPSHAELSEGGGGPLAAVHVSGPLAACSVGAPPK